MRSPLSRLPFLFLAFSHVAFSFPELSLDDCARDDGKTQSECGRPMKPVATVTPGAYYMTKIPCPECKVLEIKGESDNKTSRLVEKENDLVSAVTLLGTTAH